MAWSKSEVDLLKELIISTEQDTQLQDIIMLEDNVHERNYLQNRIGLLTGSNCSSK